MGQIILITGGQRSGKSSFAEQLALTMTDKPVYMATAHKWDKDFEERIRRHQERRGPCWTTIEEELSPKKYDLTGRVVVFDCITLWVTNYLAAEKDFENDDTLKKIYNLITEEFEAVVARDAKFIFVTNEIGCGGISGSILQNKFTDLLGRVNQYVARRADEVYLMVSGIPAKIKS